MTARRTNEDGQTAVLVVGFFLVAALLLVVVVDASAAYLRRQRLDSLADGAVLAAVDGIQGEQVYAGGLGDRAQIDPAVARQYVAAYLADVGARGSFPGLAYRVTTTTDSVEVRVEASLKLPLTPPGWGARTTVSGDAAAYVEIVD